MNLETAAQMYYENIRIYENNNGDYSRPKWCEASQEDRDAAILSVKQVITQNHPRLTQFVDKSHRVGHDILFAIGEGLKDIIEIEGE